MTDTPRFLHRDSQHGYTSDPTRAMRGEPEAISVEAQHDLDTASERKRRADRLAEYDQRRAELTRNLEWLTAQGFRSQARAAEHQLRQIDRAIRAT